MKCDVCQTTIPLGSKECPNCGFKVKKIKGIKSSTMDFDHIDDHNLTPSFDHIKERAKMPTFDHIEAKRPTKASTKTKKKHKTLVFTFMTIGLICGIIAAFIHKTNDFNDFERRNATFFTTFYEGCFDDYDFDPSTILNHYKDLCNLFNLSEKEASEIKAYVSIKDGEINDYELYQSNINHSFTYTKEDQTYLLIEPDDQISNSRYINADVINAILLYEGKVPALEDHIKNFILDVSRDRIQREFYSDDGYHFEARYSLDQMYFSIVLDD